jgi:hypothetical protein
MIAFMKVGLVKKQLPWYCMVFEHLNYQHEGYVKEGMSHLLVK